VVQGDGAAYFVGRDITNDIEFAFGTAVAGEAFVSAMTAHALSLRTTNTTRLYIDASNPYVTLWNNTHEDSDEGRESRLNFKGEQSGGEETTLARIQASHNGSADDEKGQLQFYTNDGSDTDTPTLAMTIEENQRIGIGIIDTPSARLHLPAGTATASTAPLKFTSGTDLTTPEAGVVEYDGSHFAVTEVIDRRVLSVASDSIVTPTSHATNSETVIFTAPISAAELHAGKVIRVYASGKISTDDGAAAVTIRVKIGAVMIVTLVSTPKIVTDEPWHCWAYMTIRTIGAGGTVSGHGFIMIEDTQVHTNTSSQAIDTTAVNNVTITAQWAATDADDVITIDQGFMEVLV